jgi:RNA polymerase sigma-70 factor (ECF subfamily)
MDGGEMSSFRNDVAALVPHLRAFARSLTGGDVHLADDIVQDTIVNALQAQSQFTEGTNLKAWLFTILRNRFRSVITRKHVTAEVSEDTDGGIESRWWTPALQESGLEVEAFARAFKALSPAHREVLVLVAVDGLPYEEVAEICGCQVGTIKSRVSRARSILKKMLLEGELPVDEGRMVAGLPRNERRPADDVGKARPSAVQVARARSASLSPTSRVGLLN